MAVPLNIIFIVHVLIAICEGQCILQQKSLQPEYALEIISNLRAQNSPGYLLPYQFQRMLTLYGTQQGLPDNSFSFPALVANVMQNTSLLVRGNPGYDPEKPGYDPEKPGYDPEKPGYDPDKPGNDPDKPVYDPDKPGCDPDKPGYDPDKPGYDPDKPGYDPDQAEQCVADSMRVLGSLRQTSLKDYWSFSFVDAWGKPPSGAAFGDFTWLGNYQECVRIQAPPDTTRGLPAFKGEYFASTFGYATNDPGQLKVPSVPGLMMGLCMPDSCSVPFVHAVLDAAMELAGNKTIAVAALSIQPPPHRALTPQAIGVIAMLSVLGAFLIMGTVYDVLVYRHKIRTAVKQSKAEQDAEHGPSEDDDLLILRSTRDSPPPTNKEILTAAKLKSDQEIGFIGRALMCFSVPSNTRRLMTVDSGSDSTLHVLHGVRVLSMAWVMLGHTFVFVLSTGTMRNLAMTTELVKRWSMQTIFGGSVSVDSFFLLSGVLVSFLTLREMKNKGGVRKLNWPKFYIHRYWRLTVPYMLVLGTTAALFEYVGRGPLWPNKQVFADCAESWWTNLLYVNNLVLTRKTCMLWTWYLANDMQFFWITPLFIVPLFMRKWLGISTSVVVLCTSLVVTGIISASNHFLPYQGQVLQPGKTFNESFDKMYQVPWCRIGPYIVGVLLGYVLYVTDRRVRLHRVFVVVGWCVAAAINLLVVYGLYGYSQGHVHLSNSTLAFYNATHRTAWGLSLSWLIFACVTGYGGMVNTVLSWRALVPLSRLTYMAYLCHPVVMFSYLLQTKYPFNYDDYTIIYLFFGHMVMTYIVAFVLCLMFEAPFMELEKVIIRAVQKWWAARQEAQYMSMLRDS